jgi:hypothetical protein
MNEELQKLQKQVDDLTKTVTDLRVKLAEDLARKDGGQRATAWWATSVALLIALWLGATSLWQIPRTIQDKVDASAAGQAATAAIKATENILALEKGAKERIQALERDSYIRSGQAVSLETATGSGRFLNVASDHPERVEVHFANQPAKEEQWTIKMMGNQNDGQSNR